MPANATATPVHRRRDTARKVCRSCSARPSRDRRRRAGADAASRRSRGRGDRAGGADRGVPTRPVVASWPVTEASRSAVLDRVLSAPFALDNPNSQQTRRLGVLAVMNWLRTQSGDSWQQRWVAGGGEDQPDWRHLVGTGRAKPLPHLSPGLLVLICADVIRPGLDWLLRFAPARHNLATEMARTRDPAAFAALAALCKQGGVGLQSEQQTLTQVAVIMAAKG